MARQTNPKHLLCAALVRGGHRAILNELDKKPSDFAQSNDQADFGLTLKIFVDLALQDFDHESRGLPRPYEIALSVFV